MISAVAVGAWAQGIFDLDRVQDYSSGRISSTDPNGHNADARAIEPGATLKVGEIKGEGEISHIWFTIAARDRDHLRELVLRVTWDDAPRPAIECPMGDFFAQGPGKYVEFRSVPVSVGSAMALNAYWPMPFRRHAEITVTNEGKGRVDALYYNIDYRLFKHRRAGPVRYFHTQYRNYFPAPKGTPLTLCDTQGAGHYVGTVVTVLANSDGWWGEGNDGWYVDGSKLPTITGTGSEDYFCGAWDFGKAFQTDYFGVTYYDNMDYGGEKRGIQNTVYRWHIPDPVPFTKSLLVTLEHGRSGFDEDRSPYRNSYTTVSFFYLDRASGDGPALPAYPSRVPKLLGS
jgi:hypothetical protein